MTKSKRTKTSFSKHQILIETNQRQDVVLKTILRQIRRYFIMKFSKSTNYIKTKRNKDSIFYRTQIQVLVAILEKQKTLIIGKLPGCKSSGMTLQDEMVVFFQCLLYPKDMVREEEIPYSEKLRQVIHNTLYQYSNNNLQTLFQISDAFRLVLKVCVQRKKDVFKNMSNGKQELVTNKKKTASSKKSKLNDNKRKSKLFKEPQSSGTTDLKAGLRFLHELT